jgi:hypothetical protein
VLAVLLAAAALCHTGGAGAFTTPDDSPECTPGSMVRLTQQQACTQTDRPTTPARVRREVLTDYGVPGWTSANGEIDHRVPWFLTHDAAAENLWPEPGRRPNPKDRLEDYVYRRVCRDRPHAMRVSTARQIFLGDWRVAYRKYIR